VQVGYRKRLFLAFGSIVLLFSVLATGFAIFLGAARSSMDALVTGKFAFDRSARTAGEVVTALRAEALESLAATKSERAAAVAALDELALRFYAEVRALRALEPARDAELDDILRSFRQYYLYGTVLMGFDSLRALDTESRQLKLFRDNQSSLSARIGALIEDSARGFDSALTALEASLTKASAVAIAASAVVVAAGIALSLLLSLRLSGPLLRISAAARAVADGDYSARAALPLRGDLGALGAAFDEMAARVEAYSADMERLVREKTDEITRNEARLIHAEKLTALGQLSSGIAHELNTPLGAIKSASSLAIEEFDTLAPRMPGLFAGASPEREAFWEELRRSAAAAAGPYDPREHRRRREALEAALAGVGVERSAAIADALADLGISGLSSSARTAIAEEGGPSFLSGVAALLGLRSACALVLTASERASRVIGALRSYASRDEDAPTVAVDIRGQIEEALLLHGALIKRGVLVEWRDAARPLVPGRPDRLMQIWMNLVNNALSAMDYRGRLAISFVEGPGRARVLIEDSGKGVDPALRDRLFTPFLTTKSAGEGMGLGLDIARRTAREHGGDITFESEPGRTVFEVTLPTTTEGEGEL
jgi:C4-dicarboxylate-specific signal transduction histidine kinase